MTWARIREKLGKVWGATTTFLLAIGTAIDPILQGVDPTLLHDAPWLKWVLLGLGLGMAALRVLAPPPPSVPIHIDDEVAVDHDSGTVTVVKARHIPEGITDKAPGETMPATS